MNFNNCLRIKEVYFDTRIDKYRVIEGVIDVNMDRVAYIIYSKNRDLDGDQVKVVFDNISLTGIIVN